MTTLLWLLGRAQQHLAAWAPGSFLLLIQKDLPPLLHEAEALSSLASEGSSVLEAEQQLSREIQKLTAQIQGALQLRQDFEVVRELLEEEQWGLSEDLRQTLFMLSIFQQLDGALLCLLQQPLPKPQIHRRPPCCCSGNEVQTMELPSSSLNSLENLEPSFRPGTSPAQTAQLLRTMWGGGPSPEAYLVGNQQAWLALRQHQHSRWHLSILSCLGISPDS
ncbi:Coiled-coil domain-containing protein 142 [Tupaia chinensis]|uniref:Coiled-coil domain-containing protein 142 n=1 Tax=Tupaia chinensis TaxID=246437 RepID=L9KS46_TUPCH|nr:Coiled-coil domain-containing protein 142 [Tupaia chinensis]